MARHPGFPFEPRSTAYVRPGDFWAIPTRRGGWYCCGRVLAIYFGEVARNRSIVAGLLDWCEPHPPTAESIAGARVLEYGWAHVKTVLETGGMLLGHRPLNLDGGLTVVLGGRDLSQGLGLGVQDDRGHAHQHFSWHLPQSPTRAPEQPRPSERFDGLR